MKKKYIFTAMFMAVTLTLYNCSKEPNELAHNHSHNHTEAEHNEHNHELEAHDAESESKHTDEIVLEPHDAERFGVETEVAEVGPFNEIVSVSGQIENSTGDQVTVSAPTSGIVKLPSTVTAGAQINNGNTVATISSSGVSGGSQDMAYKAALEGAKRELDRLTPLHADGIVTTREYNAALQAYETAKASYSSAAASGRVVAPISGIITSLSVVSGDFVNVGQPIATISKNAKLTLRADLPEKYYKYMPSFGSANFRTVYMDEWIDLVDLNGSRVSDAKNLSAKQNGYIPIYYTFDNDGAITPGSFVEVRLQGAPRENILTVPSSSLSEQQGQLFVYVKVDDHGYEKKAVRVGADNGKRVEILSGLKPGETVVSKGVTILKLAETSGNVPEGHSHNH
ncbi:MAG: efflux RND transporter periplasmic adaptor subunit [Muribaculaceae bacterium]|nr:efflux RND transporter periplasmic adaptor subunit [Muribaculaceae bacterium]